jgi:circadian clock protein KaiC
MTGHAIAGGSRLTTGVPGFDTILHGGLLVGSTTILQGPPGAGKTILANQIAFHRTAGGGHVVYVTLLTESHAALLRHLATLSFFDGGSVGERVLYLSGYDALRDSPATLLTLLQREIMPRRPELLAIDAIGGIGELHGQPALRQFLHELQTFAEAAQCTALLVSANPITPSPEDAVVDNVIHMRETSVGPRAFRQLRMHKSRGSPHVPGDHSFAISSEGVRVYPRIEALYRDPSRTIDEGGARVGFDQQDLDGLLGGGFQKGSSALVLGPSGTGKTLLGLSFLAAGLQRGERALYAGFYESPPRLIAAAERVGLRLGEFLDRGDLEVNWQAPVELILDAWAQRVLRAIETLKPSRLFVDGLNAIQEAAAYPARFSQFLTALFNELRARGVTTLASTELHPIIGPTIDVPLPGISPLVESAILLRYVELQSRIRRVIAILKVRGSVHSTDVRELQITSGGLRVAAPLESAEALLTGTARQPGLFTQRAGDGG